MIELTDGDIQFDEASLRDLSGDAELDFRREAQIVFQDPFESFNPRLTIQQDIREETLSPRDPPSGCRFHTRCPKVIPPEGVDFEQKRFRELMNLRHDLDEGTVHLEGAKRRAASDTVNAIVQELRSEYFDDQFRQWPASGTALRMRERPADDSGPNEIKNFCTGLG